MLHSKNSLTPAQFLAALAVFLIAGCGGGEPRNPVPIDLIDTAQPVGFENVRIWGDANDPKIVEQMMLARAATLRDKFSPTVAAGEQPKASYLALSGGGQYGAFSAGILKGWTEAGTRPDFIGVTGISTGSIIAPFAFLGSDYDDVLEEVYTTISTEDMLEPTLFSGLLWGASLADTTGLKGQIAKYVTPELLDAIAEEHRKGRIFFVGTTNIDVGRSVLWNMGAIAASGQPGALDLFRNIILASAAIPMAFPPVFFDVEAGGEIYREMHVDGGATSQVTVLSPQMPNYLMDRVIGFDIERDLHVIVNGAITPPPPSKPVEERLLSIANASMNALWYAQAQGDLYKIHAIAERDDIDTKYTWIPADFTDEPSEEFDPIFIRSLFELGREKVKNGTLWSDVPPNYTAIGSTAVERGERALPVLAN